MLSYWAVMNEVMLLVEKTVEWEIKKCILWIALFSTVRTQTGSLIFWFLCDLKTNKTQTLKLNSGQSLFHENVIVFSDAYLSYGTNYFGQA